MFTALRGWIGIRGGGGCGHFKITNNIRHIREAVDRRQYLLVIGLGLGL